MPELNTITDPNLPEPKDISTATVNEVYAADGSGSGDWKLIYPQGWERVSDTGSSQTLTASTWVDLSNDANTTFSTYLLPGHVTLWDNVSDEIDWSNNLSLGDSVDVRIDMDVTTNSAGDAISVRLDMAHGDASEFSVPFVYKEYATVGTYNFVATVPVFMETTDILNNPAKISMWTDNSSVTAVVNSFHFRTIPRNVGLMEA